MILKIISAQNVVFQGEATSVTLPGEMGLFTVLPRHASIVSSLVPGQITYATSDSSEKHSVEVQGGIVDVDRDVVSVCIY